MFPKLASHSQSLPGFVVIKSQNQCMKVIKVSRKHDIKFFTKMDINNTKYPRGSPEPAKCLLLLVSSALLFVYLAAQLRGGHTVEERPV